MLRYNITPSYITSLITKWQKIQKISHKQDEELKPTRRRDQATAAQQVPRNTPSFWQTGQTRTLLQDLDTNPGELETPNER